MGLEELGEAPAVELGEAIGQMHAAMAVAHATLMRCIVAFDRQEGWREDGCSSMAGWLCATLSLTRRTAEAWVSTAHALEELPVIAAAYAEGRLSTEQVIAAAEIATPGTDQAVAEQAEQRPGWWLTSAARAARAARRAAKDLDNQRFVDYWFDDDAFRLAGRLPAADGAVVARALERIAAGREPNPETGLYDPAGMGRADALVELASAALADDAASDRACVVVHVGVEDLVGQRGAAVLEEGAPVAIEVARRLACDARLEVVAEGPAGPVGIGRAGRAVPVWLSHHLRHRDGGCCFPGCGRRRHLQAHHVLHWAQGGPTDASNLVLVCGRHHKLVHEHGWSITGTPGQADLAFVRPDGRAFRGGPPPVGAELGERLQAWGLVSSRSP